jgi:hypothetical protein
VAAPLDEYPIHQVPLSMRYVATGDRNAYDRCIFQAHDRTGDVLLITGLGVYPNLGVIDAYGSVRRGDRQVVVRASDAVPENRMEQRVGPFRIEVVEPLQEVRLVCEGEEHGLSFDLTWRSSFPALDEPQHIQRSGDKLMLDGCRFVQAGSWSGVLRVEGDEYDVRDDRWVGTRDRSWGIRPSGEPEPAARFAAEQPFEGFWWIWAPLRFDDHMLMVIAQERPDGFRILNEAVRVFPESSGKPREQLGWPEVDIRYRSGTRIPVGATIHLSQRGKHLEVEIEPKLGMPLNIGCGYGPDPDWTHGQWKGRGWVEGVTYDLADPAMVGKAAFSVVDHVARATYEGAEGWGIFEHATFGRHDPSGFTDWSTVAP